ncbi:DUF2889 domain-containing protein [Variovorax defluvii]|uniref:DUF2889 domain-containing protein n=1 Tax=Variovorax defluvii TaxID=913761 RepID=A0ABP8I8N8_9BURK
MATGPVPADAAVTREELHFRRIDMRGFRRGDGLFEVEGRLTDQKTHDFEHPAPGRRVPAGEFVHDMGVRLVFDADMVVRDVQTFTNRFPYPACPGGAHALQSINGLRMADGWSREVRARLRGAAACTHLMEILMPMATAAFQALGPLRMTQPERCDAQGRPLQIDSCYAYAADGEIVLQRWPRFHKAPGA